MPLAGLDAILSEYMPMDDISAAGGTTDVLGELLGIKLDNDSWWWVRSSEPDTREVTLTGRTQSGEIRSEKLTLSGLTYVVTNNVYSRWLEFKVSAVTSSAIITIGRVFRHMIAAEPLYSINFDILTQSLLLKQSYPVEYKTRTRYEKIFFWNVTGSAIDLLTFTIDSAKNSGSSITIGLDPTVTSALDVENRTIAPEGVTFVDIDVATASFSLLSGQAIGFWLKQTLSEGEEVSRDDAVLTISAAAEIAASPVTGDYEVIVEPAIEIFDNKLSSFSLMS